MVNQYAKPELYMLLCIVVVENQEWNRRGQGAAEVSAGMDSLDCSHASASSVLMGSPSETPSCCLIPFSVVVPSLGLQPCRRPACLMLRMTRSPFLIRMSRPTSYLMLMLWPPLLADSDDLLLISRSSHSTLFCSGFT
jgi:hypothetical protein